MKFIVYLNLIRHFKHFCNCSVNKIGTPLPLLPRITIILKLSVNFSSTGDEACWISSCKISDGALIYNVYVAPRQLFGDLAILVVPVKISVVLNECCWGLFLDHHKTHFLILQYNLQIIWYQMLMVLKLAYSICAVTFLCTHWLIASCDHSFSIIYLRLLTDCFCEIWISKGDKLRCFKIIYSSNQY